MSDYDYEVARARLADDTPEYQAFRARVLGLRGGGASPGQPGQW